HPPPNPTLHPPSLHDALPIYLEREDRGLGLLVGLPPRGYPAPDRPLHPLFRRRRLVRHRLLPAAGAGAHLRPPAVQGNDRHQRIDRKSTRLNSSHVKISYAVF